MRMTRVDTTSRFKAKLRRPQTLDNDSAWAFVVLPKAVSAKLPSRGRATVEGSLNGHRFQATLEPDGQQSHWLQISPELLAAAGADFREIATFEISPVEQEPEPAIPPDLQAALDAAPAARAVWEQTTTIARVDWIDWITSAKQAITRAQRITNACEMLASGKRRVCCFDPSGYYSKAFCAPTAADQNRTNRSLACSAARLMLDSSEGEKRCIRTS